MKLSIHDRDALLAVSPAALSAYARVAGWRRLEPYRVHSDVYEGTGLPEIVIPRTEHLGDYATVVATLVETFAEVAEQDVSTTYRDLVTADRDVIRIRAIDRDHSGSLPVSTGADLVCCARDMVLAAVCSLDNPRPLYRPAANREANEYLQRVRLGQTDQGSFVITLLGPAVSSPVRASLRRDPDPRNDPIARRVTRRLVEALAATRKATDDTNGGNLIAFLTSVRYGVSANLCEALATLTEALPVVDISVVWARTQPQDEVRAATRFAAHDAPVLREAGRAFRRREPQPDVVLVGLVQRLVRDETDTNETVTSRGSIKGGWHNDGNSPVMLEETVTLRTSIGGSNQSVVAVLSRSDYHRAIEAHKTRAPVVMRGDLERSGQRWRLLNPSIEDVIVNDEAPSDADRRLDL